VVFLNRGDDMFEPMAQWPMGEASLGSMGLPKQMQDRWGRARVVQPPDGQPFDLLVPLYIPRLRQDEINGILALGPRQDGLGYSWNDRRGLTNFGKQIGLKLFAAQHASKKKVD
jgi:hypothetical protein